ncbi:ABC transporter ATP-binding protein [Paraburkholderia lycopersici]|uniref:Branched-chain amino acid transport system ATP-binding protein n=1 Tax=Paraburkholderia lycopersici TaxID=416944 RepID=A0A1G6HFS0_9BURK|nr:ABC transporter ATP-binding protein [Paraburkholderia lycopersici]SDB93092.1 branched-chain amino acid transport system ATP-binding protein [Paraburkholderia lycopersici]
MSEPILQVDEIAVTYGRIIPALRGVSLAVPHGAIVALLGGNGAGKSTTLKAISSLVHAERGELVGGRVRYQGEDVAGIEPWTLVERGLVQVLEGRRCFAHLTVEENLRIGSFARRPRRAEIDVELERIYEIFPRLKVRRKSLTGYTSGGEQQMVAIGRALMARPALVLLDEPSMGLAPQVVEEIFDIVAALSRDEGMSVLLAEQNAAIALRYASYGYVLEGGRVVAHGEADRLSGVDALQDAYLGGAPVDYGSRRARPAALATSA